MKSLSIIVAITLLTAPLQVSAQYKKALEPDQQEFIDKCNPEKKKELWGVCLCLMGGIQTVMPLSEYKQIEEDATTKRISEEEALKRMSKLQRAHSEFKKCLI